MVGAQHIGRTLGKPLNIFERIITERHLNNSFLASITHIDAPRYKLGFTYSRNLNNFNIKTCQTP